MPRLARDILPGIPLHVVHRGINKSRCFLDEGDFHHYWRLLLQHSRASMCAVHAYVFMSNHVHLLLTPSNEGALGALMKPVAQQYAQRFNRRYGRTGPLWEGRHRSNMVLDDRYLLTCYRYIELNPVRAAMCERPSDYLWSSHRCNAEGVRDDLVEPHARFAALDSDGERRREYYRGLFATSISDVELCAIRDANKNGKHLGRRG